MRSSLAEEDELIEARKHFDVFETRGSVPVNKLVIGRYSCLPYYAELEADLKEHGSYLIDNFSSHTYIADLANWYEDLKDITPKTWFSLEDFKRDAPVGSFVLKGQTNSKKQQWNNMMFAETEKDVDVVYGRLNDDGFLSDQNIYIREYVPLRQFGIGIRGLPITEEYRFFVLDGLIMGSGYYWSQFPEVREENNLSASLVPRKFLEDIILKVGNKKRFYVIDVARKLDGNWLVIEINDGMMSGLSDVDPAELYKNIKVALNYG
jgi:hypothetical protein